MEKELKKLKGMVDEEQTEELIAELQREGVGRGISEEELVQLKEDIGRVEREVMDAKRFRISNN